MAAMLIKSPGLKRVIRAVELRPKLLWLIRVSPWPYNLLNVLAASSDTLSFRCYFMCTALSLPKLIVHVSIGSTIRSFQGYDDTAKSSTSKDDSEAAALEAQGKHWKTVAATAGLLLCVVVFIYILIIARRAVDEIEDGDTADGNDLEQEVDMEEGSMDSGWKFGLKEANTSHPATPTDIIVDLQDTRPPMGR